MATKMNFYNLSDSKYIQGYTPPADTVFTKGDRITGVWSAADSRKYLIVHTGTGALEVQPKIPFGDIPAFMYSAAATYPVNALVIGEGGIYLTVGEVTAPATPLSDLDFFLPLGGGGSAGGRFVREFDTYAELDAWFAGLTDSQKQAYFTNDYAIVENDETRIDPVSKSAPMAMYIFTGRDTPSVSGGLLDYEFARKIIDVIIPPSATYVQDSYYPKDFLVEHEQELYRVLSDNYTSDGAANTARESLAADIEAGKLRFVGKDKGSGGKYYAYSKLLNALPGSAAADVKPADIGASAGDITLNQTTVIYDAEGTLGLVTGSDSAEGVYTVVTIASNAALLYELA